MRWLIYSLTALLVSTAPSAALADDILVRRDVTVRAEPAAGTERVDYVEPGDRLDLLDEGQQRNGFYHVRLPDGREGWVYRSFVQRVADEAGSVSAVVAGDRIAVHYIDVEQGNAALVETPCGAVMVDAGGRGAAAGDHLIDYLNSFFARRPDLDRTLAAVFVTHTHIDHNSNLRRVAEAFRVAGYIHNGKLNGSGRNAARWMLERATEASFPAVALEDVAQQGVTSAVIDPLACARVDPRITILSGGLTANPGWSADGFENGNNHSLVIRIDYGETSFLFPGDLEDVGVERLLHRTDGTRALDVDAYAVGHHGSHNGTTAGLVSAMTPEAAVISMGPNNVQEMWTAYAYGHPRRTVVELLGSAIERRRPQPFTVMVADGAKRFSTYTLHDAIYATGWDGDIIVSGDAAGTLDVRTSRRP